MVHPFAVLSAFIACSVSVVADVEKTRYFNQTLDHFNAQTNGVFSQRYYVNATLLKQRPGAPLFFIPGGEWTVGPTKGILYGMAHDLAAEHGGLMAIVEHRFYGESLPFGPIDSFIASPDRIGLLSVEQTLHDYAAVIQSILKEYDMVGSPVVALGGSYSGKLSAYMRLKFPFIVSIALAASAPIYLDSIGLTDQYAYYDVVEKATAKISPECPAAVKAQFTAYKATTSGIDRQRELNLCAPPDAPEFGWDPLEFYLVQYFATMAMFNYPPVTSPLAAACQHVLGTDFDSDADASTSGLNGFNRLLAALNQQHSPNATCFNLSAQATDDVPKGGGFAGSKGSVACSDWSGCGPGAGGKAWDYMACTEVTQPLGIRPNSTMFLPFMFTRDWMAKHCERRFGVKLSDAQNFQHVRDAMGLDDITRWPQPARIIFSNGMQDPWHAGGVLRNATATMVAITIPNGAHHQDLNGGHSPTDTPDMIAARAQERAIIGDWLSDIHSVPAQL